MNTTTAKTISAAAKRHGQKWAAICGSLLLAVSAASAQTTITFTTSKTPEGTVVSNQFSPAEFFISSPLAGADDSAFYGPTGQDFGTWATNTDLTVTGTDLGAESPALVGVQQLHAYGETYPGWLAEDGDPSFLLDSTTAISAITVTFAGDSTGSSGIADFTGGVISDVVHVPVGSNTLLETATLTGLHSNNLLIVPGSYDDWASVVSISVTYATVPEPSSYVLLFGGTVVLGGIVCRRRLQRVA